MNTAVELKRINKAWPTLESVCPLGPIRTRKHYDRMVALMNSLIDEVGADEQHQLSHLLYIVGELVGDYDDTHYPPAELAPREILRFLMDQHRLRQSDLKEIGSQGVVSEILAGNHELNTRQIKALCKRFHVGAEVFL